MLSDLLPPAYPGPARILSGRGSLYEVPAECPRLGTRGLLVHGRALSDRMENFLRAVHAADVSNLTFYRFPAAGEPTVADADNIIALARKCRAEFICAVGGGSVIDASKAAAGLFFQDQPVAHYHSGAKFEKAGLPFLAVPTTAGAGSEATPNAVLIDPARGDKSSIRDSRLMARTVVLDGELLTGMPKPVIAASGCDAFVQAVESAFSTGATPETLLLAHRALRLIAENLAVVHQGATGKAADDLMTGSFLAGAAFGVSRLGVIHGIAHPLGLFHHVPHGLVCALCLIPALKLNRPYAEKAYEAASAAVGGDLLRFSENLISGLGLSSPFKGRPVIDKEKIIVSTLASGSTKANPKPVTRDDVERMLAELFA